MKYEIEAKDDYISASYWGGDDVGNRQDHAYELISASNKNDTYKFLIDTISLDSTKEPVDFFTLANYLLINGRLDKVKIAIVCSESNQRYIYSKFNLNGMGILSNVFHTKESATNWLV